MDDTIFRLMFGAAQDAVGQVQWTTPGTYSVVIPPGVYSWSVVLVGGGAGGGNGSDGTTANGGSAPSQGGKGGGGGDLRWIRDLPVVPGETLTVEIGTAGVGATTTNTTYGTSAGRSRLLRGSTTLLEAAGGHAFVSKVGTSTTLGAKADGSFVGGGNGALSASGAEAVDGGAGGRGGGAGGYAGDAGTGTGGAPGSGYQGSGQGGEGGGVGIIGQGAAGANGTSASKDGNPGSGGDGKKYGAGGSGARSGSVALARGMNGETGAGRAIWGTERSYPSTNTQDF
jgi:hypothetical protein